MVGYLMISCCERNDLKVNTRTKLTIIGPPQIIAGRFSNRRKILISEKKKKTIRPFSHIFYNKVKVKKPSARLKFVLSPHTDIEARGNTTHALPQPQPSGHFIWRPRIIGILHKFRTKSILHWRVGGAPNENPRDNGIICDARPPRETRRTFCVLKLVSAAPARMGICYMSGWLGTKATRLARARVCVCVCVCNANNDHFPIQMAARINRAFGCMRVVWGPARNCVPPPAPQGKVHGLEISALAGVFRIRWSSMARKTYRWWFGVSMGNRWRDGMDDWRKEFVGGGAAGTADAGLCG